MHIFICYFVIIVLVRVLRYFCVEPESTSWLSFAPVVLSSHLWIVFRNDEHQTEGIKRPKKGRKGITSKGKDVERENLRLYVMQSLCFLLGECSSPASIVTELQRDQSVDLPLFAFYFSTLCTLKFTVVWTVAAVHSVWTKKHCKLFTTQRSPLKFYRGIGFQRFVPW